MGIQREAGVGGRGVCQGALCLIALLLTKCWCNNMKEALFLSPSPSYQESHASFTLDWALETPGTLIPLPSHSFHTHSPSRRLWRAAFCAPHVTLHHPPSPLPSPSVTLPSRHVVRNRAAASSEIWDAVIVYLSVGWSGPGTGGGGFFIILLTS